MPHKKWKIFYDNGETYDDSQGPFEDAPSDGVLGIVEFDETVNRLIHYGCDYYYILEDGTIGIADDLGPFLRRLGVVKFGRWAGKKTWADSFERMINDPDFPPKNSKYEWEDIET